MWPPSTSIRYPRSSQSPNNQSSGREPGQFLSRGSGPVFATSPAGGALSGFCQSNCNIIISSFDVDFTPAAKVWLFAIFWSDVAICINDNMGSLPPLDRSQQVRPLGGRAPVRTAMSGHFQYHLSWTFRILARDTADRLVYPGCNRSSCVLIYFTAKLFTKRCHSPVPLIPNDGVLLQKR